MSISIWNKNPPRRHAVKTIEPVCLAGLFEYAIQWSEEERHATAYLSMDEVLFAQGVRENFPNVKDLQVYGPLQYISGTIPQLVVSYAAQLTRLELVLCNLTELSRAFTACINLEQLNVSRNDIYWFHYRLVSVWKEKLISIDALHNPRLERLTPGTRVIRPVERALTIWCEPDRIFRDSICLFMGVIRFRMRRFCGPVRDVATLLGKALWSLRAALEPASEN